MRVCIYVCMYVHQGPSPGIITNSGLSVVDISSSSSRCPAAKVWPMPNTVASAGCQMPGWYAYGCADQRNCPTKPTCFSCGWHANTASLLGGSIRVQTQFIGYFTPKASIPHLCLGGLPVSVSVSSSCLYSRIHRWQRQRGRGL